MKIINNISERLGDDLRGELGRGSKLRVAASTFSIFAFEALRKELERIEELHPGRRGRRPGRQSIRRAQPRAT